MTDKPNAPRTSQYWRDRAEEAREMAGEMRNAETQATMLDVARMYDGMAQRAAKREAGQKKRD